MTILVLWLNIWHVSICIFFCCNFNFFLTLSRYWWRVFWNHVSPLISNDIWTPKATNTKGNTELCSKSFWLQDPQAVTLKVGIIILWWIIQLSICCGPHLFSCLLVEIWVAKMKCKSTPGFDLPMKMLKMKICLLAI